MKFWKNKLTWQWVTIYKVGDTLMNLVPFLLFCSFLVNGRSARINATGGRKS